MSTTAVREVELGGESDSDEEWVVVRRVTSVPTRAFEDLVALAAATVAKQPEFLEAVEARLEEAAVQSYVSSLWSDDWNSDEDSIYDKV
jgi:hypothetical protein